MGNLNHYVLKDKKTGKEMEIYAGDDRVIFGYLDSYYFGHIQKVLRYQVEAKVRRAGEKEYKPLQYF